MADQNIETGIRRNDIYNIGYYEYAAFYGSYRDMRYRIDGVTAEDTDKESDTVTDEPAAARRLRVTTWPGPYNFETTDDELKVSALFEYGNEGLDTIADYLNRYYKEHFGKA